MGGIIHPLYPEASMISEKQEKKLQDLVLSKLEKCRPNCPNLAANFYYFAYDSRWYMRFSDIILFNYEYAYAVTKDCSRQFKPS